MFNIGWSEILVILVVALLVLGPKRLPEIAKGLGRGLRDFRKAMSGLDLDDTSDRSARPTAHATVPEPARIPPPQQSPESGLENASEARPANAPPPEDSVEASRSER